MAEPGAETVRLPEWERLPDLGLYMDQVVTLVDRVFSTRLPKGETTRSMINNYVKSGLVPRPVGKKYDRDHLARLLMVCVLKQALSMEGIGRLLDALCENGIRSAVSGMEHPYQTDDECVEVLRGMLQEELSCS